MGHSNSITFSIAGNDTNKRAICECGQQFLRNTSLNAQTCQSCNSTPKLNTNLDKTELSSGVREWNAEREKFLLSIAGKICRQHCACIRVL